VITGDTAVPVLAAVDGVVVAVVLLVTTSLS
jgi:hypothetical protein